MSATSEGGTDWAGRNLLETGPVQLDEQRSFEQDSRRRDPRWNLDGVTERAYALQRTTKKRRSAEEDCKRLRVVIFVPTNRNACCPGCAPVVGQPSVPVVERVPVESVRRLEEDQEAGLGLENKGQIVNTSALFGLGGRSASMKGRTMEQSSLTPT